MPKLLNYSGFCENLKEVTSPKPIIKRRFHPDGLFSEQIFGPIKNYTCQCGTYYGISKSGGTCPICNVDIVSSVERRRRFAKITLPIPVVNPLFYDLLVSLGGSEIKKIIDVIMRDEKSILFIHDEEFVVTTDPESIPSGAQSFERVDAIKELVETLSERLSNDGIKEWEMVKNNIDKLLLDEVIVLPADLRPTSKGINNTNQKADTINRYYTQILTKREIMLSTIIDIKQDKSIYYQYYGPLQKDVNELYNHILEKLSKKEGLIRGNILGKRIDFSGRAVIIPDPLLKIDQCCLPYLMILELFKIRIAKKLIEKNKFKMINQAVDFIEKCIELDSPALFEIAKEVIDGEVCLLNRQPSLHRLSMVGFYIKISLDKIIKIHPLSCAGFNADFDGDQMAVYIAITEEAKQEIIDKCLITKNFINPSNGNLAPTPSQDIVLGIYALTSGAFPDLNDEVEYKGKTITKGRKKFNLCFPIDYEIIDEVIDKKKLLKILNDIESKYSHIIMSKVLDKIKKIGFKYSTMFGATISLGQCKIKGIRSFRDSLYESEDVSQQLDKVNSKDTTNMLKENFSYAYMIESGSRGSWDQARQILLTRGFISNFNLQILPNAIKHSLIEGLTKREFFNSTYGCRKGLLDVALNTGTSGYLSRKLIFACVNVEVDPELNDCGTGDGLEIYVEDENMALLLIDRYYMYQGEDIKVTMENYKDIVGKNLLFRSPIFCKSKHLCHKCYGDLWRKLHSRYVGVIAAQSLGECNTQLVLRTFHTSGVATSKGGDSMHQDDIVGDLSSASKCLHDVKSSNYKSIVDRLFKIYNTNRKIYHVHFECVVSQLMWVGYKKWRLLSNRDEVPPEYVSVQSVPSNESWLLGLAFSRPRQHIVRGVFEAGNYYGVMDKLLTGEDINK